jgi:hypothetical protein
MGIFYEFVSMFVIKYIYVAFSLSFITNEIKMQNYHNKNVYFMKYQIDLLNSQLFCTPIIETFEPNDEI